MTRFGLLHIIMKSQAQIDMIERYGSSSNASINDLLLGCLPTLSAP